MPRNRTFRRHFIGCGFALLLWTATVTRADADTIALIKSYDFGPYDAALSGFTSACNSEIVEYNLRGERSGSASLLSEIRSREPELIVAIGVLAAEFAKREFEDVTVLYVMVPNRSAHDLAGENIAGISLDIPIERQLDVYRSMVSGMRALGAIYDPQKSAAFVAEAKAVAEQNGLTLHTREVTSRKEVPSALRALLREEEIDALWMIPDDTVVTPESFKFLLLTSFEHDLPFLAASDIFVKVGALASLTPDYADVGRQGCELATALTSGRTSAAGINVVMPAKINLSINLKTARKIGLAIPEDVIATADVVYR
jgi:putative ABC transport system substrate-binding protein